MLKYILKRVISIVITLLILASVTFAMMHAVPGGPFTTDKKLPPEIEQALLEKYNLDAPLHEQYFNYMFDLIRLDLGPSFKNQGEMVNEIAHGFSPKFGPLVVCPEGRVRAFTLLGRRGSS